MISSSCLYGTEHDVRNVEERQGEYEDPKAARLGPKILEVCASSHYAGHSREFLHGSERTTRVYVIDRDTFYVLLGPVNFLSFRFLLDIQHTPFLPS